MLSALLQALLHSVEQRRQEQEYFSPTDRSSSTLDQSVRRYHEEEDRTVEWEARDEATVEGKDREREKANGREDGKGESSRGEEEREERTHREKEARGWQSCLVLLRRQSLESSKRREGPCLVLAHWFHSKRILRTDPTSLESIAW